MIRASSSPRTPPGDSAGQGRFYGWVIVAACSCLTMSLGETFWSFGVFFKPLQQEFGWSRALVSSIFTAFLLGYAISVIASGRLVDRYNPKPVLLVSALLTILGLCLCSAASGLSQFRLFFFIVGLGSGATWSVPNATVQRWFYGKKQAGLALGIVTSGVGVGALVFAPLINFLILNHGWRNTFLILGILFGFVVVAATLVLKPSPGDTMSAPRGARGTVRPDRVQAPSEKRGYASWAFAAVLFIVVVGVFTFQIVTTHMIPHATDVGISSAAAAAAMGLMGGFSIPGRVLSGAFSGRWGWHRLLSVSFFGMAGSMVFLWLLRDLWMLYLFAFSYGVFHGVRISAHVGVLPEIFGIRSLGEMIGISSAAGQLISSLAPYAAGALFDATGAYTFAFLSIILLLFIAGVVAGLLRRIAPPMGDP